MSRQEPERLEGTNGSSFACDARAPLLSGERTARSFLVMPVLQPQSTAQAMTPEARNSLRAASS
jgi:hypothetical protein